MYQYTIAEMAHLTFCENKKTSLKFHLLILKSNRLKVRVCKVEPLQQPPWGTHKSGYYRQVASSVTRCDPLRYTPFIRMECNVMGHTWVTEDGQVADIEKFCI